MLDALGNRTRLRVYRLLVRSGQAGLNVGEIQAKLALPASTLAHHLNVLVRSGLVSRNRHGREVRSAVNYDAMTALVGYLTESCCADADGGAPSRLAAPTGGKAPQSENGMQGSDT
jgi:DNA-binding transcriptional ArsR family regulator